MGISWLDVAHPNRQGASSETHSLGTEPRGQGSAGKSDWGCSEDYVQLLRTIQKRESPADLDLRGFTYNGGEIGI